MNAQLFHEALWTLTLLRREELIAEGVIDRDDDTMWAKFDADRFGWTMMNSAKADGIWRAIWRHVPEGYSAQTETADIIDLARRRGATG
jgi:hypothetical protein